jgi:hypothetical protein
MIEITGGAGERGGAHRPRATTSSLSGRLAAMIRQVLAILPDGRLGVSFGVDSVW